MKKENKPKKRGASALKKTDYRWAVKIIIFTFVVSLILALVSSKALQNAGYILAFGLIAMFIALGILFDIIGISVASADEKPFHSMSARKTPGASDALRLIRNADKVSNFCNDVVGDISGIISGTTSAIVVSRLVTSFSLNEFITQAIISSLVASVTIGGKAIGKGLALNYNINILFFVGRIIHFILKIKNRKKD